MKLARNHVPGAMIYAWLLPLLIGLAMTRTFEFPDLYNLLWLWRLFSWWR